MGISVDPILVVFINGGSFVSTEAMQLVRTLLINLIAIESMSRIVSGLSLMLMLLTSLCEEVDAVTMLIPLPSLACPMTDSSGLDASWNVTVLGFQGLDEEI